MDLSNFSVKGIMVFASFLSVGDSVPIRWAVGCVCFLGVFFVTACRL